MNNSNQPDVIIFMTDEERAIPPYETPELSGVIEHSLEEIGSKKTGYVSIDITQVLWHVYRVARRFLPVNFRMYTVLPRLTG